jgi:hypothetical protein
VRIGPGAARTILLFHTISARPSKQPRMVGSTLAVYSFALIFVFMRESVLFIGTQFSNLYTAVDTFCKNKLKTSSSLSLSLSLSLRVSVNVVAGTHTRTHTQASTKAFEHKHAPAHTLRYAHPHK